MQDMVLRSPVPVVLHCYADWCAPCKELTPVLESAVARAGGASKMAFAVLNVDEEPELAEKLQVKSLPTVFGVFQGRLVGPPLVGNAPPGDVAAFVAKLLEGADEAAAAAAAPPNPLAHAAGLLEAGDAAAAAAVYKQMYTVLLNKPPATQPPGAPQPTAAEAQAAAAEAKALRVQAASCLVGLATCAHVAGDGAARQELLLAVAQKHAAEVAADAGLAAAVANLELSAAAPGGNGNEDGGGGIAGLEAALAAAEAAAVQTAARGAATGADAASAAAAQDAVLDAKVALARALFAAARFDEAVGAALGVLRAGGVGWRSGAGRDLCVQFFDALGPGSALAQKGRRRMANLLFR